MELGVLLLLHHLPRRVTRSCGDVQNMNEGVSVTRRNLDAPPPQGGRQLPRGTTATKPAGDTLPAPGPRRNARR